MRKHIGLLMLLAFGAGAQTLGNTNGTGPFTPGAAYGYNQFLGPFFQSPFFSFSPNSLTVTWTAGTVYTGNGPISVAAGSIALTGSKTSCSATVILANADSCNYIFVNSSGTVTTNTVLASGAGGSTALLAMAVTSSTGVTSLQAPYQNTNGGGNGTFSQIFPMTVNNTPAQTSAAIQTVAQTFTYTGLNTGDLVWLINQPAPTSLCPTVAVKATGSNTLSIYFTVLTAVACTPAAGNYTIMVIR